MSISERIAEMNGRPQRVQALDLEILSMEDHLEDALESIDAELGDVLHGDGSSPDRLHKLRESIRSCQDIVGVIIENDQKRKAEAKAEGESNSKTAV